MYTSTESVGTLYNLRRRDCKERSSVSLPSLSAVTKAILMSMRIPSEESSSRDHGAGDCQRCSFSTESSYR